MFIIIKHWDNIQIAKPKFQIISNAQNSKPEEHLIWDIGYSSLNIVWDLVLGIWVFYSLHFTKHGMIPASLGYLENLLDSLNRI